MTRTNGGLIGVVKCTTADTTHVQTFTATGTYTRRNCTVTSLAEILVVAGGGGGGDRIAGGGGGGGYRTATSVSVTGRCAPVTVGAGGAGAPDCTAPGTRGSNSVFGCTTSTGGGGGGSYNIKTCNAAHANTPGGSGGGASAYHAGSPEITPVCGYKQCGGAGNTPPTSPSQGNNGGDGWNTVNPQGSMYVTGGGGGASGAGPDAANDNAGQTSTSDGGAGAANDITGSCGTYAGGGGGERGLALPGPAISGSGNPTRGAGGSGACGGGFGGDPQRDDCGTSAGAANLGVGGGGAQDSGGNGGSGVVIVKETVPTCASGVWNLKTHFSKISGCKWISRTIDLDYIAEPYIQLYHNICNEASVEKQWDVVFSDPALTGNNFDINPENLIYTLDVFSRSLANCKNVALKCLILCKTLSI